MANSKSSIREINLQNTTINLNKNKSIVSDFVGFNKNTGVWYNNALSNLWYKEEVAADDVFTIGEDIYKTIDGSLYKNDVLVKNYNGINKVSSNILPELNENTIAYAQGVNIHIVGENVYANDILICEYDVNAIPYLLLYGDTWCVIYNKHFLSKGKTSSKSLINPSATTAIWSEARNTWLVPLSISYESITFFDPYTNTNSSFNFNFSINALQGSFTLTNWQPEFKLSQIDSRTIFANILNYNFNEDTSIVANGDVYKFKYLKGLIITDTTAQPYYSREGDDINFITKMPYGYTYDTQVTDQVKPLKSIETKFLQYHSMLTTAYATICHNNEITNYGQTNFDGITNFFWESLYSNDKAEFATLTGNTCTIAINNIDNVSALAYPRIFGGVLDDLTPQWLYTSFGKFKLIYNRDALVNISIDNSIICPWNDIDENSLTIIDNDIYYYSLNSNAWVHINVSTENDIKCKVVGNKLLLNATVENCYDEDGDVFTYSVDSSYANITVEKPRMGFMNLIRLPYSEYYNTNDKTVLRKWLQKLYEIQLGGRETLYFSIGRDTQLITSEVGPIWSTITTSYNYLIDYQSRNDENIFKIAIAGVDRGEFIKEIYLNKDWLFNNVYPSATDTLDIYTAGRQTILEYYNTWVNKLIKFNKKLQDTEKAFDEPTLYNLAPNIDIMTVIDGFNTIILIKTGNNTQQIIFKNGEPLLVYNILSGVNNISGYFVLQGQQYAIINGYINRIEMSNNGQVISQLPITSVEGLKFLGNTDRQAFFYSQMNKTLQHFAADNTLEFLADATELDGNITSVFSKQTNDIFLLLNDKVVVLTNSGSMFEVDNRAEYIVFGDKYWSSGDKVWSYYKIDNEQKRYPISLETLWYGNTVNRSLIEVDTIYIELYDDNFTPGKFEISLDSLMNNTASTKKQTFNIKTNDYDKVTKTVYLRFQPSVQKVAAFKLNINSELPIKRIAVGYSTENIPLISKNNI